MVKEEGGVRFMDSYLWANIHDEVSLLTWPANMH